MKKISRSLFALMIGLVMACDDDLEIPSLEPSFTIDPMVPEVGLPIMFDNLTLNAERFSWDFGDGNTSEDISPTHTYEAPGTYEVTVTAWAVDGQQVSASDEFDVLQRVFTGYQITDFPLIDRSGDLWDAEETSADSLNAEYPDVIVALFPDDEESDVLFVDGVFVNVTQSFLFGEVDPTFEEIVLTNEDWTFVVVEIDGDLESTDPNDTSTEDIARVAFNPVTSTTTMDDSGTSGVLRLFGFLDNGVVDIELLFDLE